MILTATTTATTTSTGNTHMVPLFERDPQDLSVGTLLMPSPTSEAPAEIEPADDFDPSACLFCSSVCHDVTENYHHMYKRHGLFIPDQRRLLVDLESLLRYLHLVIFEYNECLYCHTSRRTVQAVQQHMMGTGHCKFDISDDASEFRDFYDQDDVDYDDSNPDSTDSDLESGADGDAGNDPTQRENTTRSLPTVIDDANMRLPSGRIVANRSAPHISSSRTSQARATRSKSQKSPSPDTAQPVEDRHHPQSRDAADVSEDQPKSKALQKQERRAAALAVQLKGMRAADQRALAHLPVAERRSLLARAMRESSRLDRSERSFRGHMDRLGNIKSKERFVNDVPGGKSHKNRFLAQ